MATYYVRADGTVTAANKANATSDSSASTSLSRTEHNSCIFSPGDTIVISDLGGEYFAGHNDGGFNPPSDGAPGNVINYEASGSPIVNGYILITGWTAHPTYANVWVATWTDISPRLIGVDLTFGYSYASDDLASMSTNGDWAFDTGADEVYLYDDTNDPDTYSSPGVSGNWSTHCFNIASGRSYITIDGIHCRCAQSYACPADEPGPGITFKNCIGEYSYKGFSAGLNGGSNYSGLIIEDCIGRWNTSQGIGPSWNGTNITIRRNSCHHNGTLALIGSSASGIKSFDDTGTFSGYKCYENEIYSNGRPNPGVAHQGHGAGIWLDYTQGTTDANRIHHNLVYDNIGVGIFLEICQNSEAYGNIVYNNATDNAAGQSAANIVIDTRYDFISQNNLVYNNTVYGGQRGIKVDAYYVGASELNNNIVKNNIATGFSTCALVARGGGNNDGINGSGNVYDYNCWGAETAGFVVWGSSSYDTYSAYQTVSSQGSHDVEGDPSLTNAAGGDFTLKSDSPCINTGVNLGSPYNAALMPSSTWPGGVVTGDQGDY